MLQIGNLRIKYRALLSPMASITDIVFRKLIEEIGGVGLMVTEMISAEGIKRKNKKTMDMIRLSGSDIPQFVQLFGSKPEQFVEAIKYIENETDFSGIDINMGCPVRKVIKKGAGAALLTNHEKMTDIIRGIKKNSRLPISVKIRLGYSQVNVSEVVKILQSEGVDAIIVHFRLSFDKYNKKARWEYAPLIKKIINTTFIGNGDIFSAQDARSKLKIVDGVMIGRGAVINPLIFVQISEKNRDRLINSEGYSISILNRLIELIRAYYEPELQLVKLKSYVKYFFFNKKYSKSLRQKVYQAESIAEAHELLSDCVIGANNEF